MVIWVIKIFLCSSSVYSCHLFLISSLSISSLVFLPFYCVHLCMKYSLGISNFLEEISSLFHSIIFLYFFELITEEGFLIYPWYSLELCIHMAIPFFLSISFCFSSFTALCKALSDNYFAFLHLFFLGLVSIMSSCTMSWTSVHSSLGTLSDLIPWIYLSVSLYNHKGFDLGHTWMV